MKTLIVYYSLEGNTKWAVTQIAAGLNADTLELVPRKPYPTGGFGKSATFGESPELAPFHVDVSQYGRIILATPIWAGTFAPPLRTFLRRVQVSGKRLALVACSGGGSAEKAFSQLRNLSGVSGDVPTLHLISPKTKPAAENDAAIKAFCDKLENG